MTPWMWPTRLELSKLIYGLTKVDFCLDGSLLWGVEGRHLKQTLSYKFSVCYLVYFSSIGIIFTFVTIFNLMSKWADIIFQLYTEFNFDAPLVYK